MSSVKFGETIKPS